MTSEKQDDSEKQNEQKIDYSSMSEAELNRATKDYLKSVRQAEKVDRENAQLEYFKANPIVEAEPRPVDVSKLSGAELAKFSREWARGFRR